MRIIYVLENILTNYFIIKYRHRVLIEKERNIKNVRIVENSPYE